MARTYNLSVAGTVWQSAADACLVHTQAEIENRARKNLPASRRKILERAKDELRRQFGRA
jgi:Protein of unknown function (DUF3175)